MDIEKLESLGGSAVSLLFQRLPDRLFAPLAATNRQLYWALLCMLYRKRFGPDAPLPPMDGFPARDITLDIEGALTDVDDLRDDTDGPAPVTDINVRAHNHLTTLIEAGWLKTSRRLFEKRLQMAPAVSQFLSKLVGFAETGPVFVAGKIRSVETNLKEAIQLGAGDSLMEAAETARNLLEHIRNTGMSIRDLMDQLGGEIPTREYVRLFFNDYVETVFIGDYKRLRTQDHPLTRRAQILAQVDELYGDDERRTTLINWYQANRAPGNTQRATRMFERDIERLLELSRIDEYLDRLDDEIRRANKRALVYLDYRIRALRPLDEVIQTTIQQISASPTQRHRTALAPGYLISPTTLTQPRRPVVRAPADALRNRIPSATDIARARLIFRARDARTMTAPKLATYVAEWLGDEDNVTSRNINVESVEALRAYQTLFGIALPMSSSSRDLVITATTMAKGFRVRFTGDEEVTHKYISGRTFQVTPLKRKS